MPRGTTRVDRGALAFRAAQRRSISAYRGSGREAIQDCEAMECSFRGVSKIHPPLIYSAEISFMADLNQW
jgi:hypothetical protein